MVVEYPTGDKEVSNWLRRKLWKCGDGVWGVPIWHDYTTLSTTLAVSGTELYFNTTIQGNTYDIDDSHFDVGREIIVVDKDDWSSYETATLTAVSGTFFTLTSGVESAWGSGDYVMPVIPCRIPAATKISRQIQHYDKIGFTATQAFDQDSDYTMTYTVPDSGASTYRERDILYHKPMSPIEQGFNKPYTVEQSIGIGYKHTNRTDAEINLTQNLIKGGRDVIWDIIRFFDNKRGQWDSFWVPTWNHDLVLTQAITAGDTILYVQDIEYSTYYEPNTVIGKYVVLMLPSGPVYREISDATSTTILFTAGIMEDVSLATAQKMMISFLTLSRFAIDEIEIDYPIYSSNSIAYIDLRYKGLINETYGIVEQGYLGTGNIIRENDDRIYPAGYIYPA